MTRQQVHRRPTLTPPPIALRLVGGGTRARFGGDVGAGRRVRRGLVVIGIASASLLATGCMAGRAEPTMTPESFASRLEPADAPNEPRLLAAHVLHDGPPSTFPAPGDDELQLVFSHPLDPTSITPDVFLVLGADGRRVTPARAVFAPADEADEGRALVLQGDFGEGAPTDVRVLGHARSKDGRSLRGSVITVWPLWEPPRLVMAYRVVPVQGRCAEANAAIRTWWSQPIVGPLADSQVRRFLVRRSDGVTFSPRTADDQTRAPVHAPPPGTEGPADTGAASPDDAVLDLCFDEGVVGGTMEVPGGVVVGSSGRAAEAQTLPLLDDAAGEGE